MGLQTKTFIYSLLNDQKHLSGIRMFNLKKKYSGKYAPIALLFMICLAISFVTRLALWISFAKNIDSSFLNIAAAFGIGLFYDILIAGLLIVPFAIHICFTNDFIYTSKGKWLTFLTFIIVIALLLFTPLLKDFNGSLFEIGMAYLLVRFGAWLFLLTRSVQFRLRWRSTVLILFFSITLFLLIFNAVSEWFFWNEFSARYNFIAVDYLVYTNEVVGNIKESYPLFTIITLITLFTAGIIVMLAGSIKASVQSPTRFGRRIMITCSIIILSAITTYLVQPGWQYFSRNNFINELAGNGIYDFTQAFQNNELDYYTYYKTIPDSIAFKTIRKQLETPYSHFVSNNVFDLRRNISYPEPERKMNVVLISVESLSASFMQAFGNQQQLTPNLDSIAKTGILFTNLYASGTRTVRGLEALSLSIPPLPGQSVVKRPDNENLFSLGSLFRSKGYITQYIYGGYSYFDNMDHFFSNNGYEVIDRSVIPKQKIHYANVWGVADEDLFSLSLNTMDENFRKGKPFFEHIMTVSNHRPYTYPSNRIDIPADAHSRDGAVKYTDYAIGKFIKEASAKPWFSQTIFVIVADHCASSAGKEGISLPGYHIPMIMYAPALIKQHQDVTSLMAQVDIAPTIAGLLNMDYTTKFFGQDIFRTPDTSQHIFVSTYQALGFANQQQMIVLSPVKKVQTYDVDIRPNNIKDTFNKDSLITIAQSYYQVMAWTLKNKKYSVQ